MGVMMIVENFLRALAAVIYYPLMLGFLYLVFFARILPSHSLRASSTRCQRLYNSINLFEQLRRSTSSVYRISIKQITGCITLSLVLFTSSAYSHAPSWSVDTKATPVTLRFTYTDGKAMSFSKVRVLAPDGEIFQIGNADRNGFFSFIPTRDDATEGNDDEAFWTVSASGDEGHEIKAEVTAGASSDIQSRQLAMSASLAWLLVASVIVNFAFIGAKLERFVRRRSISTDSIQNSGIKK